MVKMFNVRLITGIAIVGKNPEFNTISTHVHVEFWILSARIKICSKKGEVPYPNIVNPDLIIFL